MTEALLAAALVIAALAFIAAVVSVRRVYRTGQVPAPHARPLQAHPTAPQPPPGSRIDRCTCPQIDVTARREKPGSRTVPGKPDPNCPTHGTTSEQR